MTDTPSPAASGVCNGFVGDGPHYACSLCGQIGTAHEGVACTDPDCWMRRRGRRTSDGTGQQPAAAGVVRYAWDARIERYLSPRGLGTGLLPVVRASDYDALQAKVARLEAACVEAVGCFDAAHIEGITRCMEDGDMYLVRNIWNRRLSDVRDNLEAALQGADRG